MAPVTRHTHARAASLRLPGGVRWGQLALHRTTPGGRRTLIATGHRRFDGSIDWTSRPHRRVPAAVVALLLRAEVRR